MEGGADLGVQVEAVDHDQDGGVAQGGLQAHLLGGEDHQQGLARALEVPDQSFAGGAGQHALHDHVGRLRTAGSGRRFSGGVFVCRWRTG